MSPNDDAAREPDTMKRLGPSAGHPAEPPFASISRVLADYFDALYDADPDKIAAIFHPRAIYATVDLDPPLYRDLPTYLEVMAARESPRSRGESRRDFVDRIEMAGDNTASARVRCSIGGSDFVDFLSLVREDGRWQIIAKVFQVVQGAA